MVLSERRLFAAEHILGGSGANWTDMPSGEKMNDLSFLLVELTTFCDVDEDCCCCCCCSIVVDGSILGMNPISKKDKWHTRYEIRVERSVFSLALLRGYLQSRFAILARSKHMDVIFLKILVID